jgi:hypothetical protein
MRRTLLFAGAVAIMATFIPIIDQAKAGWRQSATQFVTKWGPKAGKKVLEAGRDLGLHEIKGEYKKQNHSD